MDNFNFKEVLDNMEIDDIRHVKIEWYDGDYYLKKAFEYHEIKTNKEEE